MDYDGVADLALVAIATADGRFGGVRLGNASLSDVSGWTGMQAPGMTLSGPLYVGDIRAAGKSVPVLLLGAADDARGSPAATWNRRMQCRWKGTGSSGSYSSLASVCHSGLYLT